ncbi:MAG TPA: hypothetical protein VGR89_06820, partial [Puia sp.]|nr:hypothetical protein [Puia sp.]
MSFNSNRLYLFFLLIFFGLTCVGQKPDTFFVGKNVLVNRNGMHIYDTLTWRAMQWEKQQRAAAGRGFFLAGVNTPPAVQVPTVTGGRVLSVGAAHSLNNCGVTASFTPSNDSVVKAAFFNGTFTSTSTNGSTLTWYENGWWAGTGPTFYFGANPPGLYQVSLVAQNGSCSDTASCYYYITGVEPADRENIKGYYGTPNDEHSTTIAGVPSGGYLLGGYGYTNKPPWYFDVQPEGMLIKVAESGCIEWSKKIPTMFGGKLYKVLALQSGGYACSGYTDNTAYFMKLDALGNTVWTKIYYFDGAPLNAQWICETGDGGFALAGLTGEGITVLRTDAGGNVLWTRAYSFYSPGTTWYYIGGILALGQAVYLTGNLYANVLGSGTGNETQTPYGILVKLNDADGTTAWTKQYQMNGSYIAPGDLHPYGSGLLVNSTIGSSVPNTNNTLHFLDVDGNPLQSVTLSTPAESYGLAWTTALPLSDGSVYVLNAGTQSLDLQPGYAYHTEVIKLSANLTPSWSFDYGHYAGGRYFFPAVGQNGTLAILGDEIGQVVNTWSSLSDKLMFKKFNDAAADFGTTNYPCGFNATTVITTPQVLTSQPFTWTAESSPAPAVSDTAIDTYTVFTQVRYECPEFLDSCSFMKLTGASSICDLSRNYTYRIHRNNACAQPIQWELPPGVGLTGHTDTTV